MVNISDTLFSAIEDELNQIQHTIYEKETERIIVVDSVMGSGKTSWTFQELFNKNPNQNILYITPYLKEIEGEDGRIPKAYESGEIDSDRRIITPRNMGKGKIGNIADLINNQADIASTHELFRRFDEDCKQALKENKYTLILDETLDCVEPYFFKAKDDAEELLAKHDIEIDSDGLVKWTGSERETRWEDVRLLAQNKALFRVDDRFFVWHYPAEIFKLFRKIYILTYMFDGSLMKYYFDLYDIKYTAKSISGSYGNYKLVDYYKPNKESYQKRIKVYEGIYNKNIPTKDNVLSTSWSKQSYNSKHLRQIQKNMYNYCRNEIKAKSDDVMWTSTKANKSKLKGKGYTNGFVSCNARASNDYRNKSCLMYAVNWFINPEINKFFLQHNIKVNQDSIALATLLQWVWRSNIRESDSNQQINIYIPSARMRRLFYEWLSS